MFILVLAFLIGVVAGLRAIDGSRSCQLGCASRFPTASRHAPCLAWLCVHAVYLHGSGAWRVDQ